MYIVRYKFLLRGTVVSTPNRVVQARALAGAFCCALGKGNLLLQCLSPPRCTTGYRGL